MTEAPSRLEWLSAAASAARCPLCVAAARCELRDLRSLVARLREGAEVFSVARGLCRAHIKQLERAARDDRVAPQAIHALYAAVLEALVADLSDLEDDEWLTTSVCQLCAERDRVVARAADALLVELERAPVAATALLIDAGGLCVWHFLVTWEVSPEPADRDRLRRIERAVASRLAAGLRGPGPTDRDGAPDLTARAAAFLAGWDAATPRRR
jgi:hypothetical protein